MKPLLGMLVVFALLSCETSRGQEIRFQGVPTNVTVVCNRIPALPVVTAESECGITVLPTGMVLHLSFDTVEGTNVADSSGFGNHGYIYGGPVAVTTGRWAGGLRFDGLDDYLRVRRNSSFHITNFTISAWVQTTNAGTGRRRIIGHQSGGAWWVGSLYNNRLELNSSLDGVLADGVDGTKGTSINDGAWHMVALTRDVNSGRLRWYVDSQEVGSRVITNKAGWMIEDQDVYCSKVYNGNENLRGTLDDLRIYSRVLSLQDIRNLYSGPSTNPRPLQVSLHEERIGTCPASIIRIWTASNDCGVVASATQTITVVAPVLSLEGVPEDLTAECGSVPPPADVRAAGTCPRAGAPTGLVLHLTFDDIKGSIIADSSERKNQGTSYGDPIMLATGRWGGALQFDGVDDYIRVPHNPSFHITNFTASAWIKTTGAGVGRRRILGHQGPIEASGRWWVLSLYNNRLEFNSCLDGIIADGVDGTRGTNLNDGAWHQVAVTRDTDAGLVKWYVDGSLVGTRTTTNKAGWMIDDQDLFLSRVWDAGEFFRGAIDDVRLYERALTSDELALSFSGGESSSPVVFHETVRSGCPGTIERVWSATDACGCNVSATQRITTVDLQAPVLRFVPGDVKVYCGQTLPNIAGVEASDVCSTASLTFLELRYGDCPGRLVRVWTARDACGNESTATQLISLVDAPPPTLVGVPPDANVGCGAIPSAPIVTVRSDCPVPSEDLILHLTFDTLNGSNVIDHSRFAHHGYAYGGITMVDTGMTGRAFLFDGVDDYIRIPSTPFFHVTNFTVSAWVRTAEAGDGRCRIIGHQSPLPNDASWWVVSLYSNHLEINSDIDGILANGVDGTKGSALNDSVWHMVTAVRDTVNGLLTWYVDGSVVGSRRISGARGWMIDDRDVFISKVWNGGEYYHGLMDELRVYRRALTSLEIGQLWKSTKSSNAINQVAYSESIETGCPTIVTRKWYATDGCGGEVSATQRIVVVDTVPPILNDVPGDVVLFCDESIPAPPAVSAQDDCGSCSIKLTETKSGTCPTMIVRTWVAADLCGNASTGIQRLVFVPVDVDGDGVRDEYETGSGVFVSPVNTGTSPALLDSDNDGQGDGLEIARGTDPNDPDSRSWVTDVDFDADFVSDIGVYIPSHGLWTVHRSSAGVTNRILGGAQFYPVVADFNGDGSVDISAVDVASGRWMFSFSDATGDVAAISFKPGGALPLAADFDGDGIASPCLYETRSGKWRTLDLYGAKQTVTEFGFPGAIPVAGDYDGDGRDDFAVFDPLSGVWYIRQSSHGMKVCQFGYPGVTPIVGDFDGDHRDDIGVYDAPRGRWYHLLSVRGFSTSVLGWRGARPVIGDFDGDSIADRAVFATSFGRWVIDGSRTGLKTFIFGPPGAISLGSP